MLVKKTLGDLVLFGVQPIWEPRILSFSFSALASKATTGRDRVGHSERRACDEGGSARDHAVTRLRTMPNSLDC